MCVHIVIILVCICVLFVEIKDAKFYFISFEYLCETEEGEFLPCEVGLIEWSLNQGIIKTLHRFINPGAAKVALTLRFHKFCFSQGDALYFCEILKCQKLRR